MGDSGSGGVAVDAPRAASVATAVPTPPDAAGSDGRGRAQFALGLLGLGAVAVVVPLVVARQAGALGVPRGDDWSYLRTLLTWVDGRGLDFNHWVSMTLLGQLVLAAPVALATGRSITALQVFVAIVGFVGLCGLVAVTRQLTGRRAVALLVAYTLALGPLWAGLATTFMTDIPGVSFAILAAAVGLHALRPDALDRRWLAAGVVVGLVAFSIREYAAVPTVAIVVVAVVSARARRDGRTMRVAVGAAAVAMVLGVVLLVYWRTVPGGKPFTPSWPTVHSVKSVVYKGTGMARLIGLWLVPLVLYARPATIARRAWRANRDLAVWTVVLLGVGLAFTGVAAPRIAFAGNYVVPNGFLANGVSAGRRPDLLPASVFDALIVVGSASVIVCALMLVPLVVRLASRQTSATALDPRLHAVALMVAGYVGIYAVAATLGLPLYDRYVLPIVAFVGVLVAADAVRREADDDVASSRTRTNLVIVGGALVLLGALSMVYAADSASFDAVRWHVAERAVAAGWRADQVGGSFEWVNWWSPRPGTYARKRGRFCVAVVVAPKRSNDTPAVARGAYRPPFHHSVEVLALRTARPGCAPRAVARG